MKAKIKLISILLSAVLILGLIGCSSSNDETKEVPTETETSSADNDESIALAVEHIEEGDFDEAQSVLNQCFEGKAAELKNALNDYNSTVETFYNNYGSMPVMDDIYKDYKPFKERVNAWKNALKDAIDYEEDIRDDYEKMQDYCEKEDYDKCIEMSEGWNEKIEKKFPEDDNAMNGIYLNKEILERLENFTYPFSEENLTNRNLMDNFTPGNGWDDVDSDPNESGEVFDDSNVTVD